MNDQDLIAWGLRRCASELGAIRLPAAADMFAIALTSIIKKWQVDGLEGEPTMGQVAKMQAAWADAHPMQKAVG